ncbi:enolase-phosphatase E1-like [Linepithema humile]|uniref:enolase-phosphatase E1-like n=1 Tax=Linepithema humile TaxID=83485 RepID=UPI00351EED41
MEQQQEARNLITFLLTIVSIHFTSSSNQNVYTIDIGTTDTYQVTDHVWLQPLNTTTSSYQESTTYLPVSTSITTKEILDSSETNAVHRYTQPSYRHSEEHKEADNSEEPSDHVIAYSEHEEARDVPTRPKYVAPGIWAKPPPDKNIPLDFVPKKLHAQVRGTHVVKKVPQREAIESAETDEEKRNAHRLREVVTNSKVNTVYTEEGYEDSAYDHAGHVRDADFHEGFARKLHDEKKSDHHSSSGQNKEKENDEFKDYKEDYKDHLEESRKVEQNSNDEYNLIGYGRNAWKERSEIDPKLVIKNGIRNLEEDIEKDAEETERSSQIYQKAQESKHRDDVKTDSSESEESRDEDDLKDEENKPTKSEKKGFKLKNGKANFVNKGTKQSHGLEKKKLHENHEMTVIPFDRKHSSNTEIPASLQGFVTNPSSLQTSVDQTTLRYVAPTALSQIDEPTTISYSQMFWDYFKARQTPSSTESSARSSTANSRPEERKPIAVATIDGHGPYLLVTQDATTTSPSSTLFDSDFGVSSAQAHNRHLLGRSDDVNYVDNVITASTTATFTTTRDTRRLFRM